MGTITKNIPDYAALLSTIKKRISESRVRAARAACKELIDLYWYIGMQIAERQESEGWGKSVVEKLSQDLRAEYPGTQGYSATNLWQMRRFFITYREHTNL